MTGNMRKMGYWNRPNGHKGERVGRRGQTMGDFRDAVDLEDAVLADSKRRARDRRESHDEKIKRKSAEERRKITLPTLEWITNFMKDAPDDEADNE